MIPVSGTRTCTTPPWPTPSVTESSTTPIPSKLRASPCESARASPSNSRMAVWCTTLPAAMHHLCGSTAPCKRWRCTIIRGQAALLERHMQLKPCYDQRLNFSFFRNPFCEHYLTRASFLQNQLKFSL